MPGNIAPRVSTQVSATSTGSPQLIKHRLGRAPRFISVFITNIDMATPGNYTRTLNSKDQTNVDITVIPAGLDFVVNMGR